MIPARSWQAFNRWRRRSRVAQAVPAIVLAVATIAYVLGSGWSIVHDPRRAFFAAILGMALAGCLAAGMLYTAYRRYQLLAVVDILQQLTAWISHEYTNSAVRMGMHLTLVREGDAVLNADSEAALAALERERKAMRSSTDAILRLTRTKMLGLNVGNETRETRDLNLTALIDEATELVEGKALSKNIELRSNLSPARIAGDGAMIVLMALNLIENAVKYTPADGQVLVTCETRNGTVHLSIADSGPGIPAAMRERVFQPGQRISETESEHGSGFGLALVREIVRLHKGRISIGDSAMDGADFRLQFAAAR